MTPPPPPPPPIHPDRNTLPAGLSRPGPGEQPHPHFAESQPPSASSHGCGTSSLLHSHTLQARSEHMLSSGHSGQSHQMFTCERRDERGCQSFLWQAQVMSTPIHTRAQIRASCVRVCAQYCCVCESLRARCRRRVPCRCRALMQSRDGHACAAAAGWGAHAAGGNGAARPCQSRSALPKQPAVCACAPLSSFPGPMVPP